MAKTQTASTVQAYSIAVGGDIYEEHLAAATEAWNYSFGYNPRIHVSTWLTAYRINTGGAYLAHQCQFPESTSFSTYYPFRTYIDADADQILITLGATFSGTNAGEARVTIGSTNTTLTFAGSTQAAFAEHVNDPGGTPTWSTTETAAFNDATDANFDVFPASEAVGDYVAFGYADPFYGIVFDNANGTAGAGGVGVWEYYNGASWASIEGTGFSDGTSDFTAAVSDGQEVVWAIPKDWATATLNGSSSLYFVRFRITTVYTTNPVYDQGFITALDTQTATLNTSSTGTGERSCTIELRQTGGAAQPAGQTLERISIQDQPITSSLPDPVDE